MDIKIQTKKDDPMALYDLKTKEELQEIVDSSETLLEIALKLGYKNKNAKTRMKRGLMDIGISFQIYEEKALEREKMGHKNLRKSRIWEFSKDEFQKMINESYSIADLRRKMNFTHSSVNETIKKRIEEENIDMKEFNKKREEIRKYNLKNMNRNRGKGIERYLKKGTRISSSSLRKILIRKNVLEEKCVGCGIGPEYNSKPITLQLDHIDGDRFNNELVNLRILCPNCHSQTETFSGRNKTIHKKCVGCGVKVHKSSKRCSPCDRIQRKLDNGENRTRPTEKELMKLVVEEGVPFLQIGKKYGVSDNAIRKWCKAVGVPYRKKDIKDEKKELLDALKE